MFVEKGPNIRPEWTVVGDNTASGVNRDRREREKVVEISCDSPLHFLQWTRVYYHDGDALRVGNRSSASRENLNDFSFI